MREKKSTLRSNQFAVGISAEKGVLSCILLNENKKTRCKFTLPLEEKDDPVPVINSAINKLILSNDEKIGAIGIAFPGITGINQECLSPLSDFPDCSGRNITSEILIFLRQKIPVITERDAVCALNFFRRGRKNIGNCLLVSARKSLGAAIMLDGEIIHGICGMIGKFGHIKIAAPAKALLPCACGKIGCIETIAGGTSWRQRWENVQIKKRKKMNGEFKSAVSSGQPEALRILEEGIEALFPPILSFISLFSPEFIVFDIDLPHSAGLVFATTIHKIFERERILNPPKIEFFFESDFAAAFGAALFAVEEFQDKNSGNNKKISANEN